MDLRGQQLRDAYDSLMTIGSSGEAEDGQGTDQDIKVGDGKSFISGVMRSQTISFDVPAGEDLVIQLSQGNSYLIWVTAASSIRYTLLQAYVSGAGVASLVIASNTLNVTDSGDNLIIDNMATRKAFVTLIAAEDIPTVTSQPE